MAKMLEQYNMVHSELSRISNKIREIRDQITALDDRQKVEIPARIDNIKVQLLRIDDAVIKINGYKQIAQKYLTSMNLPTIEAPEGYRVNLNRLQKWAAIVAGMPRDNASSIDSPEAMKLYEVACCDLVFLQRKKVEFEQKLKDLEKALSEDVAPVIAEMNEKIAALEAEMLAYVCSDAFRHFAENVVDSNNISCFREAPAKHMDMHRDYNNWTLGLYGCPLDIVESVKPKVCELLDKYYIPETDNVMLSIERLDISKEFAMTISCVPAIKRIAEMDAGIRNLALNFIDKTSIGSRKIYLLDAERLNTALAGTLTQLAGSIVMADIPQNKEQIQTVLEEIISSFVETDELIGACGSVAEYNTTVEASKQLPRSLVIFVGGQSAFSGELAGLVKKIFENHERYGISFISANIIAKNAFSAPLECKNDNVIRIEMGEENNVIRFGAEKERRFDWNKFMAELPGEYCQGIIGYSINDKKNSCEYSDRVDTTSKPSYKRAYKQLSVPYGIDSKEELRYLSFENKNFATYISGRKGSGKSSLLNVIIAGLVQQYHPDNVELWLADFTEAGLADISHMPPHVKYLLMDDSRELICDFIDKLADVVKERQQYFSKSKIKKYENLDPQKLSAPVPAIFVIVDGFAAVSSAIKDSQTYKDKLKNILTKGEKLGLKFILSGNDFTAEVVSLSPNAKSLVHQRIALKASKEVIEKTLELNSELDTNRTRIWIEALPKHYALVKQYSNSSGKAEVKRVKTLYFSEPSVKNGIADKAAEVAKPAAAYKTTDTRSYVDKKPLIKDRDSFEEFPEGNLPALIKEEAANKSRYKGDETFISFGTPRLMKAVRLVAVTPGAGQNILLLNDKDSIGAGASVAASALKSFRLQEKKVELWTSDRNPLFREFKDSLFEKTKVLSDAEAIAERISAINDNAIGKNKAEHKLIVVLGLEEIVSDLNLLTEKNAEQAVPVSDTSEKEAVISFDDDFDNNTNHKDEEGVETEATSSASEAEKKPSYAELLIGVLKDGGRADIHFMVVINRLEEINKAGLSPDMFKHRLAFATSAESSEKMFGSRQSVELPESIAVYSDTTTGFSMWPYIHNGLEPDSWKSENE